MPEDLGKGLSMENLFPDLDLTHGSYDDIIRTIETWLHKHPNQFMIVSSEKAFGLLSDDRFMCIEAFDGEDFAHYSTDDMNRLLEQRMFDFESTTGLRSVLRDYFREGNNGTPYGR